MVEIENSVRRYRVWFCLVILTLFFFRLWFSGTLPLSGDEAYHWEWSRHLALGYYDHPGLTAYLIRLSTFLFNGSTEISVRFVALVMLTLTAIVVFLLARSVTRDRGGTDIQAERAGFIGGFLILIIPIYAAFSTYISTDPPLIFFWTLSLYLLYRAFSKGTYLAWILAGMAFGFAVMSKFLAFFIIPASFLFILISVKDRKWLGQWQMYAAGGVCLLVILPFVIWNMQNGWPTFMFNFIYRQAHTGFHPEKAIEFVGGQALALSPVIFGCAIASLWWALKKWKISQDRASLFLALTSIVPLIYFFCVGFRRQVGLHWPTAGWIGAVVLWSCYTSMDWVDRKYARRIEKIGIIICLFITISLYLLVHIPQRWIESGWSYWGDPERINLGKSVERFGWRELGQKVYDVKKEMLSQQKKQRGVFVICNQYGLASSVAFYTPDQMDTHLWVSRKVHGENYRFWDNYSSMKHMDAIFLAKVRGNVSAVIPHLRMYFVSVGEPEYYPVILEGKEVRSFYMVRCHDFNGIAPAF
ncbi:MAG: glycosyltransferase family 39 protein [Kiritimatiellae bacterium]|nr:glycosyltransferase family 39 protein [Kiritimatiellia bacterium]MDD5520223.1 glycosyltransferase family 39 protein [Kiritimatiellia bacterium]